MNLTLNILKKSLLDFINSNDYNLINESVEESTTITKYTSYNIKIKSDSIKRKISFSLTDYYSHRIIFINIYNIDGKSHSSLSLDKYLEKFCNIKNAKDLMNLDKFDGKSLPEKLENFFIQVKFKLDKRFFEILKGLSWVEIPFDWGQYK